MLAGFNDRNTFRRPAYLHILSALVFYPSMDRRGRQRLEIQIENVIVNLNDKIVYVRHRPVKKMIAIPLRTTLRALKRSEAQQLNHPG